MEEKEGIDVLASTYTHTHTQTSDLCSLSLSRKNRLRVIGNGKSKGKAGKGGVKTDQEFLLNHVIGESVHELSATQDLL